MTYCLAITLRNSLAFYYFDTCSTKLEIRILQLFLCDNKPFWTDLVLSTLNWEDLFRSSVRRDTLLNHLSARHANHKRFACKECSFRTTRKWVGSWHVDFIHDLFCWHDQILLHNLRSGEKQRCHKEKKYIEHWPWSWNPKFWFQVHPCSSRESRPRWQWSASVSAVRIQVGQTEKKVFFYVFKVEWCDITVTSTWSTHSTESPDFKKWDNSMTDPNQVQWPVES